MNKAQVEEFLSQSQAFFRGIQTAGNMKAEIFEKLSYGLENFALKNGADKKGVSAMVSELKELTERGWDDNYIPLALEALSKHTKISLDVELCALINHRYAIQCLVNSIEGGPEAVIEDFFQPLLKTNKKTLEEIDQHIIEVLTCEDMEEGA